METWLSNPSETMKNWLRAYQEEHRSFRDLAWALRERYDVDVDPDTLYLWIRRPLNRPDLRVFFALSRYFLERA